MLTESMALKKIKLLDVLLEGSGAPGAKDEGGFDADVALSAGQLRLLLPDLIDALGGEHTIDQPAAEPAIA